MSISFVAATLAAMVQSASPPPTSPSAGAAAEKLICRRTAVIGSLVPSQKECHTRAQWAELARVGHDAAQADADRRIGRGSLDGR